MILGGTAMAIIRIKESVFPATIFGKCPASQAFNTYQSEMNRMFNSIVGSACKTPAYGNYPLINVSQDQNHFYVTAELPGIQIEDITIDVQESALQIDGDRKIKSEDKGYYLRREREFGSFSRKITFQHPVFSDQVSAKLKDGILQITLPKKRISISRKISITDK
jgi:HSP20 family protein